MHQPVTTAPTHIESREPIRGSRCGTPFRRFATLRPVPASTARNPSSSIGITSARTATACCGPASTPTSSGGSAIPVRTQPSRKPPQSSRIAEALGAPLTRQGKACRPCGLRSSGPASAAMSPRGTSGRGRSPTTLKPFTPWLAAIARRKWVDQLNVVERRPSDAIPDTTASADHEAAAVCRRAALPMISSGFGTAVRVRRSSWKGDDGWV
jgi:hypothetical protein